VSEKRRPDASLSPDARGTKPDGKAPRGTESPEGIPVGIQDEPPRAAPSTAERLITVWADGPDLPANVCFDARLDGGKTKSGKTESKFDYPLGTSKGQAGWDMGINFRDFSDLADQLSRRPVRTPPHIWGGQTSDKTSPTLAKHQIERLAIVAHGRAGSEIMVNGTSGKSKSLSLSTIKEFRSELNAIGDALSAAAVVLFMGCAAALFKEGIQLIIELSKLWPGSKVVAFPTIGLRPGGPMKRSGTQCCEAGMRATSTPASLGGVEQLDARLASELMKDWEDLGKLPWAWEELYSARVAQLGKLIKDIQPPTVPKK
jgi:hypothetical protein